ncbi:CehA/McbA family metallohydrolase [Alkalicoccobacillus plakortidis]|uniref:CehA/McbA family metallohydrolase n=1 Tax=Alkalicoccobacillus plakortidis TaxID=444060 RepID=A0ABT0XKA9_9BACI|nr:CehA/McbA family metallohydrolase [Alkalicoccobacillus plakortidis]MCM2676336.1 CehA/McbA family metallohydrolase [Alkalicoccobacillus plakortidis]
MIDFTCSVVMEEENQASIAFPFEWKEGNHKKLMIQVELEEKVWLQYQLVDANQEVRAQYVGGKTIQPVVVGETTKSTSPNTVPGPMPSGEWTLHVQVMGREVTQKQVATILLRNTDENAKADFGETWIDETGEFVLNQYQWEQVKEETARWYKGDFHTHTIASDGQMTREDNVNQAEKQGLDFFVATDHNLVPTSWTPSPDLLVIPGIEITAKKGHFNILGVQQYPYVDQDVASMETEEGIVDILKKTKETGGLNSMNHPFLTEWKWLFTKTPLALIDTFEVWNDPTYSDNVQATEEALRTWDLLTNDGWTITGIGGSDSHLRPDETYPGSTLPSLIGDPGTYVWSDENSANALLRNVKQGHVFVARENVRIDFQVDGHLPGSSLSDPSGDAQVTLQTNEPLIIQWVENGEVVHETIGKNDSYSFQWKTNSYSWLRVTVRKQDGTLIGFTNPVYYGRRNPSLHTWGDVLERLD